MFFEGSYLSDFFCSKLIFLDLGKCFTSGFPLTPSLIAILEYVEEKTGVDSVFVNFQSDRKDRGRDCFGL